MNTQDVTAKDLETFFGEKSEKYIHFWEIYSGKKKPKGMSLYFCHWPAFFLGPIWMCYRKLYWQAIAFSVGMVALVIIIEEVFGGKFPSPLSGILSATLAQPLALWSAMSIIKKINAQDLPEEERQEKIRLKGGTSKVGAGIATALVLALVAVAIADMVLSPSQ